MRTRLTRYPAAHKAHNGCYVCDTLGGLNLFMYVTLDGVWSRVILPEERSNNQLTGGRLTIGCDVGMSSRTASSLVGERALATRLLREVSTDHWTYHTPTPPRAPQ